MAKKQAVTYTPGQRVEFGVATGRRGPQALSLKLIDPPPSLTRTRREAAPAARRVVHELGLDRRARHRRVPRVDEPALEAHAERLSYLRVFATPEGFTRDSGDRLAAAARAALPSAGFHRGLVISGDRFANMIMDSSTYGVPVTSAQGYKTPVDWATRMSYSGIFFHSAPWSVGQQGYSNTSHGCLNLSPSNAKWVYDNTKRGDIVVVKNTVGGTLSGTDGLGDWNIPWSVWKTGNADV